MISQSQIAQDLGVSQTLVSQVLNGRHQYCNQQTYARIWRHAIKHSYRGRGLTVAAAPADMLVSATAKVLRKPR